MSMRMSVRRSVLPVAAAVSAIFFLGAGPAPAQVVAEQLVAEPVLILPENPNPDLPNVRIVGLGGTILGTAVGRDRWQSYGTDAVSITEILDRISPEIDAVANVSVYEWSLISSGRLTTAILADFTRVVDEHLADPEVDGVVINTGTNVMEEIAYWLDLTLRSDKPVVLTGSMRQSNTFSFDGLANLFNAITLAASQETTCFGPVLLMNDEFTAAREVTKTDAVRTDTFGGQRTGILGMVDELNVRVIHAPARVLDCGTPEWQTPFDLSTVEPDDFARVEIAYSYIDAGAETISALVDAGVDGIVTAGHGAGSISTAQGAARAAGIEAGVVFVAATRAGSGSVYTNAPGIIGAGDLLPQKARLLLQLGLTFSDDIEQIREWFTTIGMPEFNMAP